MRRVLAALALLLCVAPVALADGDPASDVLLDQNVFLPISAATPSSNAASLSSAVRAAYARNYRIKVAVIASQSDLGSIPSLFGKPVDYAAFLGQELGLYYEGPLLVVMPAGYGIYDGGRSTKAERKVLASAPSPGSGAGGLTASAARVVTRMLAAGALKSKDVKPPYVAPAVATVRRGQAARLYYQVFDDSGKTREVATVRNSAGRALKTWKKPLRATVPGGSYSVAWNVPKTVRGRLRFCVTAYDRTGNHTAPQCARVTVAR